MYTGEAISTELKEPTWGSLWPYILRARDTMFGSDDDRKHAKRATHCSVHKSIVANGKDLKQAGLTLRVPGYVSYPSQFWIGYQHGESRMKTATAEPTEVVGESKKEKQSAAIESYSRRDDTTIIIAFYGGNAYRYDDVPKETLDGFEEAESKGSYYNKHLHKKYDGEKL